MLEQLRKLREQMKACGIDAYVIPTDDDHGSEYVGDYYKTRQYISGFTGSAGTVVVTQDQAGLWTDGRYFLQAAKQLEGSGITLYKMGEPKVPKVPEFLRAVMRKGGVLGYDGRMVMVRQAKVFERSLASKKIQIRDDVDLVGKIWKDRPAMSHRPAWILDVKYAGESLESKIEKVRKVMDFYATDHYLLASLEDIAWLLNVRGDDIESTPVVLSYLLMTQSKLVWYVQPEAVSNDVRGILEKAGVTMAPYHQVYQDVAKIESRSRILFDSAHLNAALFHSIPDDVYKIDRPNPTLLMKATKNAVEVENERTAHKVDGVAVTKFIYWLKKNVGKQKITEISAAEHLEKLREEGDLFLEDSFAPIIAYDKHGAIVHYSATEESNVELRRKGLVLADTGGHYLTGTTDITRTISLGALTTKEKEMYTTVLKCHIDLADAHFKSGCTGQSLDGLARNPLWQKNLDFNHGTGHGVGYLLSVHEGPNNFRYRKLMDPEADCVLKEGMITSDEPGIYLEGEFGVRIENLIVCVKDQENEFGTFLKFEPLTMVPYDRDAIDITLLTEKEKNWLNQYQKKVYDTISPYLSAEESQWLKEETAPF
ncbi:MAG: aminopeptidase P family N-terminal domain-containing protein [Lachnospiraceae bacterium]|nr:aminopeptidase P family N-terminal domain-containing protein [Lachnospiraceae bacterium]